MQTIFSWEQFIDIARFLVQETKKQDSAIPDEAAYRCAISRSYYAAFRIALDYAMDTFDYCPERSGMDHTNLRNFMREHGDVQLGRIAEKLTRLRNWRKKRRLRGADIWYQSQCG
ncbi:hypothetical protein [Methanosphaerula subterraneus]|uniref:hypothetical protein n=1 Tax=Methanosphaerula subterraneus TaxID=3350244 RepID=UPI003F84EE5D